MKAFLTLTFTVFYSCFSYNAISQETIRPLNQTVVLKTNVLNLIARGPSVSIEKFFPDRFSAELSFVSGRFDNILVADYYDYNGFLLRGKKYFTDVDFGKISPFGGIYAGNLKRNIQRDQYVNSSGYFGWPGRDFSANSIRAGASFGLTYITKSRVLIEGLGSLGYGVYTTVYKQDIERRPTRYLDTQTWLSLGYCF